MTELRIIKGYWWISNSPDEKVAGVLTYTPGDSLMLEIIGQFKPNVSAVEEFINSENEDVIYGLSSDAKKITLINCHRSGGSLNFSCPFPVQKYNCRHLLVGVHIESLEAPHFFKAQISMPYLSLWASPNAIENTTIFKENNVEKFNLAFNTKENNISFLDIETYRLSIDGVVNYKGDYYEPQIRQKTIATITKTTDFSLKDILHKIFLFEQFISFAVLKYIKSNKLILFDNSVYQELNDGKKHFFPIEYIQVNRDTENIRKPEVLERTNFLFTYETIKQEFHLILKKWFLEQDDIAPIRHHLIECVRHKGTFSSVDFLMVIQAIEGFWWRFRESNYRLTNNITGKRQTKLHTILSYLINEFQDISSLKLNEIKIEEVVDSRHYFSHFILKDKKPFAKDGLELYHLYCQIRKLLICCLLNFVGFKNEQISAIVSASNNSIFYN